MYYLVILFLWFERSRFQLYSWFWALQWRKRIFQKCAAGGVEKRTSRSTDRRDEDPRWKVCVRNHAEQPMFIHAFVHAFTTVFNLLVRKSLIWKNSEGVFIWKRRHSCLELTKEMTKWICRVGFFIENVEIMKKCGKEMIKGALRLYINDFIRLSHLSISADLHNLLVLPPKMYRWLSQIRPKHIFP